MKKIFALLALVLGVVSCQTEPEGLDVNVGGEQKVMLTVSLPETTRANSANGFDLNSLADPNSNSNYSLRYILEVYRVNDDAVLYDTCQRFVETSKNTSMVFPVRLAPGYDYRIVAWTDIVEGDSKADRCYTTTNGLDAIEIIENMWNPMDETRDAYTHVKFVDNFSSASNLDMTLKRPFAKLRVVATDIDDIRRVGLEPTTATVEYSQDMYFKYNAVADIENKGAANDARAKSHNISYPATPVYEDATGEMTLFADYIFVPSEGIAKFNLTVKDADGNTINKEIGSFNTDIPVKRNNLTTIKGNVLTEGHDIKVTIDERFDGNIDFDVEEDTITTTVNTPVEFAAAFEENSPIDVVVLNEDINLDELFSRAAFTAYTLKSGRTLTIDLNGKTIRTVEQSEGKHYYAIYNHGILTIKDSGENGAIVSRGIYNYGTLTLESGKIDACDGNGGYAVYNQNGSTFVMNGGMITTSLEDDHQVDNGGYDATTLRLEPGATAIINGGTIDNICDYTFAIDNYGEVIVNDGTFTSIHSTVSSYGTMTINGGSFIRNGLDGVSGHALIVWNGSNTTINGGTFDGQVNNNGYNVYADKGAVVEINGGNFLKAYIASLYGAGTINVKGGTFFDDPSARVVKGYVAEKNGDVFVVSKIALAENFADNSWDKIILACQNNIVPESWNVGDKKAMTINGKDYQIRIIGKNHDTYTAGGTAPLTFQIAEVYGAAPMNATQTNTTGWSGSKMRTETMAEILKVMPVKDAIKAVNKETLNGTRDGLETTSDKLFLLSEIEVNGSVYFSNNFEEGSRYAFFGDVDSMKLNATYWLRGPGKSNAIGYTQINMSGYMANGSAEYACGVVFGFCF